MCETDGCWYGRDTERRQSVRLCEVQDGFTQEAACGRFQLPWPAGSRIGRYHREPVLLSRIDIVFSQLRVFAAVQLLCISVSSFPHMSVLLSGRLTSSSVISVDRASFQNCQEAIMLQNVPSFCLLFLYARH